MNSLHHSIAGKKLDININENINKIYKEIPNGIFRLGFLLVNKNFCLQI
jgi:glutathionyl-hydroquinone reductase